jgi:hypothetical protein
MRRIFSPPEKLDVARRVGATDVVDASAGDAVTGMRDAAPEGLD